MDNQQTQLHKNDQHKTLKLSRSSDPYHGHKTLLIGIGVNLILFIGLLIGYYLGTNNVLKNIIPNDTEPTKISSEINEQISPTTSLKRITNWKAYTSTKVGYELHYPAEWYAYEYPEISPQIPTTCTAFSDIPNPQDIPVTVKPAGHQLMKVCFTVGPMPTTFPYQNGSANNPTIKETSINFYKGIRGKSVSTLGVADNVFLSGGGKSYVQVTSELGDEDTFNQILATIHFE